jgi:hypothetical protein
MNQLEVRIDRSLRNFTFEQLFMIQVLPVYFANMPIIGNLFGLGAFLLFQIYMFEYKFFAEFGSKATLLSF